MKWQYGYTYVPDEFVKDTLTILNEAGEQGWEFTGHVDDTGFGSNYLMKRAVGKA